MSHAEARAKRTKEAAKMEIERLVARLEVAGDVHKALLREAINIHLQAME